MCSRQFFFFFSSRRRHTRCSRDWSSDVCSSDLFRAEDVHHFAFSLNPDYIYEQGRYGEAVVRVLYRPGDRATWGQGKAVQNTVVALAWLDSLFGKYQWPQLTNVHRIEGGGTEFPMMIMDGSASIGLIVHETGHQYVMGQLANNEWREGWLDEGFSDFQEGWFLETHGGPPAYDGLEPSVLRSEEHTSELQSRLHLVCRLLLEKKK